MPQEVKREFRRGCPKCTARNLIRQEAGLDPLPGHIHVRSRDGALWCRVCAEAFFPQMESPEPRGDGVE
jgi:hypothetical protein